MSFSMFEAEYAPLADLIREAQSVGSNDSIAMNELLRRYEPLVRRLVADMNPRPNDRDDLLNGARWGLVQAVRKHDGRSEGFIAFATRYMRGEALRAVERTTWADVPVADDTIPEEIAQPEEPDLPDIPLHTLTSRQHVLVNLHYWEDQTYATIARGEGVTLSAVRQRMTTIHRALTSHMTAVAA
jgi:RNA polymerase sigma factor (sigma-70 family)